MAVAQLVSALPGMHRAPGSLHSTSIILALGLWKQEDSSEVKVISGYIMSSSRAWAT